MVAEDTDPVRLSRSKRAQFLRRLAVEISVEKRSFSPPELVAYAEDMSTEYDYGIDAISFVQSFVEKGLIHFAASGVEITLPFMQAYLLAAELTQNPAQAKAYFDISDNNFDLLTFDLYAEIGPSDGVIASCLDALGAAILKVGTPDDKNPLLGNEIYPRVLKSQFRLNTIKTKIIDAREALETGASDREEKARILDIGERINEDIAAYMEAETAPGIHTSDMSHPLFELIRCWAICTVLLGSGAEGIKGDVRKSLCEVIIVGADAILSEMGRAFTRIDFKEIRNRAAGDTEFRDHLGVEDEREYAAIVDGFVDLCEFMSVAEPLEKVVDLILDQAQQVIIGNSLARPFSGTPFQEFLRALWLSSISRDAGRGLLSTAISNLPDARFFRSIMSSLLIQRVRWRMSVKASRLLFIDAAEAIIKPINPLFDKGELRRFVDRDGLDEAALEESNGD